MWTLESLPNESTRGMMLPLLGFATVKLLVNEKKNRKRKITSPGNTSSYGRTSKVYSVDGGKKNVIFAVHIGKLDCSPNRVECEASEGLKVTWSGN